MSHACLRGMSSLLGTMTKAMTWFLFHLVSSTQQYYVAETPADCPSDGKGFLCHSLSEIANPSTFGFTNNTVFYFVPGVHTLHYVTYFSKLRNVTLIGMKDQENNDAIIYCNEGEFIIKDSSYINFFNLSLYHGNCPHSSSYSNTSTRLYSLTVLHSSNITISGGSLCNFGLLFFNGFDVTISSITAINSLFTFNYMPLLSCPQQLNRYTLNLTDIVMINLSSFGFELSLYHNTSYHLLVNMNGIQVSPEGLAVNGSNIMLQVTPSLYSIYLSNISSEFAYQQALQLVLHNNEWRAGSSSLSCANLIEQPQTSQLVVIKDSFFINSDKGGILITQPVTEEMTQVSLATTLIIIKSCVISFNYGFGLAIYTSLINSPIIHIIHTIMHRNTVNLITDSNGITFRDVTISDNLATGLVVSRSTITINNTFTVTTNRGRNGGGIAMYEGSNIIVHPNTTIFLTQNMATQKGGGLYVNSRSQFCPFTSSGNHLNITIAFDTNYAPVGEDVYGINFDNCNRDVQPHSSLIPILQSTDPIRIEFCYNTDTSQSIYPGQNIYFTLDLYGRGYRGTLRRSSGDVTVTLGRKHYLLVVEDACFPQNITYIYNYDQLLGVVNQMTISLPTLSQLTLSPDSQFTELTLYFTAHQCPIGFNLTQTGVCNCSQNLLWDTVTCDINNLTITHNGQQWIGLYNVPDNFNIREPYNNECILKETCYVYCTSEKSSLTLNDTDSQCIGNRANRMCGSCSTGYSLLLGSNRCGLCHNNYTILWSLLFALMGIILVLILVGFNLTVSIGTVNGILFYANILKLYEPIFSKDGSFPVLSQFIAWINLDFGVEICFYNGLDRYTKEWLQFVFPFYLWLIIIIIIILCLKFGKISRLVGTNTVPTLATLFLLSYMKLVRTIVIVLHKREVTLYCGNTTQVAQSKTLWYEDPTVEYGDSKHVIQVIFALGIFTFFIVPFTLFLLLNPLFEKYLSKYKVCSFWNKIKPIIDAYSGPMKDRYRFWPGFLLIARLPVLLSVTLVDDLIESRSLLLSILLSVLIVVFSLAFIFHGVYKTHIHNVIEAWFLLNLTLTVALAIVIENDDKSKLWYSTYIGVFIVSFIGVILYHLHLRLRGKIWYERVLKKLHCLDNVLLTAVDSREPHKTVKEQLSETKISTTYIELRRNEDDESVIELFVDDN